MRLVRLLTDGTIEPEAEKNEYLTTEAVAELAGAACLALTALLKGPISRDPSRKALALRLDAALSRVQHTEHGKATRG